MFLIRRIYDDIVPVNREAISKVQQMLDEQIPGLHRDDIRSIPEKLRNPLKHGFQSILYVAEKSQGNLQGFAFLLHETDLNFHYLEYISSARKLSGRGIGGALYQRVRQHARNSNTTGIFIECLPDDPELSPNPEKRKQNMQRLRFYETFGARPVINTAYETPLKPGDADPPYLLFDNLGTGRPLSRKRAQEIVRSILEKKYGDLCPESYISTVVRSFKDDPVKLREPRYIKQEPMEVYPGIPADERIVLTVNDRHDIHHIRERGYVESPIRINSILKEIDKTELFDRLPVKQFPEKHIKAVHDAQYVDYLKKVCKIIKPGISVYPYVFPIRNTTRPPRELPIRAGYFCMDTFTPLNQNAYLAARRAVDCVLTAADQVLSGRHLAYALVRPPGHHAEKHAFGGFCYFNSAAAGAHYLSEQGKTAILDIDYHHGNGQQDIFNNRSDVLTISIHGHPRFAYPYFSGFEDEQGEGNGSGFNINFPLSENMEGEKYRETLKKALNRIRKYRPDFLILCLGLDPAKGDPTGTWSLKAKDFELNGAMIGELNLPTLIVQEGGYNTRNLGINARSFFSGLWKQVYK
ncbi:MAG: GNAT family N-acetyltransferase [Calditrichia bacterium]